VIFNYIVGNNDAHGKNFSLLYRAAGTEYPAIGLSPLYDVVCTVHYPELSRDMAMRIGRQYSSAKVTARNFEQLAAEAGLGKPLVRGRVAALSERVIAALPGVAIAHPAAQKVAALIRGRAENALSGLQTAT
jgi:serine/threonine-protein kinase HipA